MRVRSDVLVPVLAASVMVATYGPRSVWAQSEPDLAPIDEVRSQYEAAYNGRDAAGLAALFEDDGILLPDHSTIREGRAAIQAYYEEVFAAYTPKLSITPTQTDIAGDQGHEHGTYSLTLRPTAGGPVLSEDGKYLVILKRQADGSWKIHHNMNNTNVPSRMIVP